MSASNRRAIWLIAVPLLLVAVLGFACCGGVLWGIRSLLSPSQDDALLCGISLLDVVAGKAIGRTVMSEYHAAGAATGVFMIRHGRFKYVHYIGMPPQLFDLEADPDEMRDLGGDPGFSGMVATCYSKLRRVVDPERADALARSDQAAMIAHYGGRDAILQRGAFGFSPPPGTKPVIVA